MKIELSPWVVAETSATLPRKRRRTPCNGDTQSTSYGCDCAVVAAFLGDASGGSLSATWEPIVTLTFAHKVTLLGSVSSTDGSLSCFQENSAMQYVTRSTPSASFISTDTDSPLPWIPCLCQRGRLYAFLEGNSRLLSWMTDQTPDEGVSAKLNSPALSLASIKDSIFGTCRDGSLFVGRMVTEASLEIDYIDAMIPASAMHVATFCDVQQTMKRKKATSKTFFQIYTEASRLFIYRHTPTLMEESYRYASKCLQCELDATASDVCFVGRGHDEVVLSYTSGSHFVCCSVSLSQARILNRIELPFNVKESPRRCIGLVGSLVAVVGAQKLTDGDTNTLCLYDIQRGGIVSMLSLDFGYDKLVSLLTDGKDRLALVVVRDDVVCVVLSSILWIHRPTMPSTSITLAEGLSARVGASRPCFQDANPASTESENAVSLAVRMLKDAHGEIRRRSAQSRLKSFLSEVYMDATRLLSSGESSSVNTVMDLESANNPQEPSEKLTELNGKGRSEHVNFTSPSHARLTNGVQLPSPPVVRLEPRMLPEAFLEPATLISVDILLISNLSEGTRNDARVLLRRFVRSGKISARRVLSRLYDILESLERLSDLERIAYSPVDLIFDMFRCCKDVSEYQTVIALHYLLANASTRDICSHFRRNKHLTLGVEGFAILDNWERLETIQQRSEEEERHLWLSSSKVALAAITAIIPMIALYSKCNEVLLRNAARKILSQEELGLVCRVLADSLSSKALDGSPARFTGMQWLGVVCEELQWSAIPVGGASSDVAYAQATIVSHARTTESILGLKHLVATTIASSKRSLVAARSAGTPKKESAAPSYQIERLVF